jgi:ketosteroid isomerase-like protein
MTEANLDLLRRGFELFARGEIDKLLELFAEDVDWAPAIAPILGIESLMGKDEIRRFFLRDLYEGFDAFRAEPLSFEDFGDQVLVMTRYVGRGERSGLVMDQTFASVYTVRDGKLAAFRDYETRAEAFAAMGVPVADGS